MLKMPLKDALPAGANKRKLMGIALC